MRSILLVLTIALAGCGNDDGTAPAADMSVAHDLTVMQCATTCGTCAAGTTCVSGMNDFNAACLKSCTDQRDCPSGKLCARFRDSGVAARWCIDQSTPSTGCGFGCAVGPEVRCDGDVALNGVSFAPYCATAYEYCPHGCSLGDGDGGFSAKCNP